MSCLISSNFCLPYRCLTYSSVSAHFEFS
uniref:Uncharacterized protein n=1 Tax=Rhizophora mucronata TaxID=61149 RepID=A0A2P2QI91_RHIMU